MKGSKQKRGKKPHMMTATELMEARKKKIANQKKGKK